MAAENIHTGQNCFPFFISFVYFSYGGGVVWGVGGG